MFITACDISVVFGQTDPLKELDKIFRSESTESTDSPVEKTDPLKELDKIFRSESTESTDSPVEKTDRDNDPDDMTVDSIDGPLKIQFELERDPESTDFYDIKNYTFEFRGLQQGNYKLQENEPFGGRISADRGSVSLLGLGNLEVKNGTEIDIMQVSGFMTVDKIKEGATQTTYSLEQNGLVTIGDLEWYDVTGNLTTTADGNEGTLVLVDKPYREKRPLQ